MRNRAFDHLRREEAIFRREGAAARCSDDPSWPVEDELLALLELQEMIARLPARCRLIFRMSREHEMTYREIADSLGISIKTVETQMGRALKALRDWLSSPS
jgi:RNA polymerase sigma-70 factor (ECF subfamily)